jgi:hypothetical protein
MLAMVRRGCTVAEIIRTLHPPTPPSRRLVGHAYERATAEVMAVIRDALSPPLTVVGGARDDDAEGAER